MLDYVVNFRNGLHPWIQILVSCGWLSLAFGLLYALLREVINTRANKDMLPANPIKGLAKIIVIVFKEVWKFVLYIRAYWFPVKEIKPERTHRLKLKEWGRDNWRWYLLDYNWDFVTCSDLSFDTRVEAKSNANKILWWFTTLDSIRDGDNHMLSINISHKVILHR